MVLAYNRTGILDRAVLKEMGVAVGTRHLLQLKVDYAEHSRITMGLVTNAAEQRQQKVELFAHIWDTDKGDVVWEATGGAAATSGEFAVARAMPDILAAATKNLVARLPVTAPPAAR
jgi:hypothetical protein